MFNNNKTIAISSLVIAGTSLAVILPALIISHKKALEEKGEKNNSSYENVRDMIVTIGVGGFFVTLATNLILDSVKLLKK